MYINGWGICCYAKCADSEPWVISPEDAAILNTALGQYSIFADDHKPLRISAVGSPPNLHDLGERELVGALAALAILQCNNVDEIVIRTGRWQMPDVLNPVALDSLVSLQISEVDSDLGESIGSGAAWIVAAALTLRRLRGNAVTNVAPELSHDNLRVLDLRECGLSRDSFDAIAKGFPKLEEFIYSNGSCDIAFPVCEEVSPQYAMRAMRPRRDTLRHLSLSWERAVQPYWTQDDLLESLACMTALEEISVSSAGLALNKDVADLDTPFFIEFFPPNLREITIRERSTAWNLAPLAEIASSHLQNLTRVQVVCWRSTLRDREADLKELFGTRGIELQCVEFGKNSFM
ncbi:hypothetical protein PCL_09557 [Purpureocillium lilacinum]|uniref:Uncharacterized protein n=1 Tax=Purpureocillium lilacinum TaxID=33203 RepID=A0A2U3DQM7_PURLI|nr:hypothetical protein PCL_09557 [Purpureocillium lilacinum]